MIKRKVERPSFVLSAMLAGHLYRMMSTAKLMLLSASNAKGVAARAGDKATGFRPITDYIAEMAHDTIRYATTINQLALTLSRTSVSSMRAHDGATRFEKARAQLEESDQYEFIDTLITESVRAQQKMTSENKEIIAQLSLQLEEINQRARGSTIVVSTSRTEASRSGDFQKYLNSIADSVEQSARTLNAEISECRKLLYELENAH
ncbi:hypothetical protein ACFL2V_14205 [Pseudomonadota bacterium]